MFVRKDWTNNGLIKQLTTKENSCWHKWKQMSTCVSNEKQLLFIEFSLGFENWKYRESRLGERNEERFRDCIKCRKKIITCWTYQFCHQVKLKNTFWLVSILISQINYRDALHGEHFHLLLFFRLAYGFFNMTKVKLLKVVSFRDQET